MANRLVRKGEGAEREGEEHYANSAAQPHPQPQRVAQSHRFDQAGPHLQESHFQFGHMSAALPEAGSANYQGNAALRQSQGNSGEGLPLRHREYAPTTVFPTPHGPGVPAPQYPRQPYQQGRHTAGFPPSYTGAPTTYSHPQSFGHSYPPQVSQMQGHPAAYDHAGTAYYPIQQQYPRQMYDNTISVMFRQEPDYLTSTHTPGVPTTHVNVATGLTGSALPQGDPTSMSRQNSVSSAYSSTLRGPPRKPRQSGYALWCGNLPAQTDIVSLKDHFSRDAKNDIQSVFLISKSNCAFINYKTEEACTAALARFHDSRFQGAKLVCRLRKPSAAPPAGTPTGPRISPDLSTLDQPARSADTRPPGEAAAEDVERIQPMARNTGDKFFVLKSLTVEDLDASVRNGSWATQTQNEDALNAAYNSAKNVYLVFSANKSGEYYGYARMMSGIDDSVDADEMPRPQPNPSSTAPVDSSITIPTPATEHAPKGYIIDDSARGTIFWEAESDETAETTKDLGDEGATTETTDSDAEPQQQSLGHTFKVQWISTDKVPFHRARGLRNPWNLNREVKIARDATPIEPSTGRKLVNLFSMPQVAPPSAGPPQMVYTAQNQPLPLACYPLDPRFTRHY